MSYDILIIDPTTVPTATHEQFMDWYNKTTLWNQPRDYSKTDGSSPAIADCYNQLTALFPDINSDYAVDHDGDIETDEPDTEYTIGDDFLYIAFVWSDAKEARVTGHTIARNNGLAFVDVSDTTTIHFADGRKLSG